MATAWQTLEEAALTLGISSRTLHRRIARGEFETRLANGRREVLVTIADPPAQTTQVLPQSPTAAPQPVPSDTSDSSADSTDSAADSSALSADVSQTMLTLHEDRIRRTDLAIMAYQQSVSVAATEARRSRISSRLAWSLAGMLTAVSFVLAIWATHRLTDAQAKVDSMSKHVQDLSAKVQQESARADTKAHEAELARQDAEYARIGAARAEGELGALRAQIRQSDSASAIAPAPPTTQPMVVAPTSQPAASLSAWLSRNLTR